MNYETDSPLDLARKCVDQEKKQCNIIDARIEKMEKDFINLLYELDGLKSDYICATGFIKMFKIRKSIKSLAKRITINKDLRKTLYSERIKNTL